MKYLLALGILILMGCSSRVPKQEAQSIRPVSPGRVETKGLSQEEAEHRASAVGNLRYSLTFDLSATDPSFRGTALIDFDLKETQNPLTVDFTNGTVSKVEINGQAQPVKYNGLFLTLMPSQLKSGSNTLAITFSHPYGNSGTGLHRFKDPEDGRTYLYTHFEPYNANQLFPCFDQPNLKATFKIQAEAPSDWTVISSRKESQVKKVSASRKLWVFPESASFSTYLISLHAGPYQSWESTAGKIPLRLFSRRSFSKYVKFMDWFTFAKQGLQFYQRYFDFPYPFVKFDMIIAPDFNMGAMENVAAITFSERFVARGNPTREERETLASVILHEMAHQWFGDLVTMKWWNGLWLNESFATFMASLALKDNTEFKKSWESFFIHEKQWAYQEDQWVTTHPIEVPVPDTEQAFSNFDGITYGKGASVLKQASYYIGDSNFRAGVQAYFKKFAFKNASLSNFMGSLEDSSKLNLQSWTGEWLQQAGLNTLEAQYECRDGKIDSFKLVQTAPAGASAGTLRTHRTEVALFSRSPDGKIEIQKVIPVTYRGSSNVSEAVGQPCPTMVFPNYGDYDYVKIKLDSRSVETAQKDLSRVSDEFTRLMMWTSLWNMVRDGTLAVPTYANLVFDNLAAEKEFKILDFVLSSVYGRRLNWPSVLRYLPREGQEAQDYRVQYLNQLESFTWSHLAAAKPGSDFQKRWFDAYVRVAQSKEAQQRLSDILSGKSKINGLAIDQDRRWNIVWQLSAVNSDLAELALLNEKKRDPSNTGINMAISAQVVRPELPVKKEWFVKIFSNETKLPFAQIRSAMRSLFPPDQDELHQQFSEDFFKSLPDVAAEKDGDFQEAYTENLTPALCNEGSVTRLGAFLNDQKGLTPIMVKDLRIARQEDERCLNVRQIARQKISVKVK